MSAEVLIGDGEAARLAPHPLRAAILGEVHARPFTPIEIPVPRASFRLRHLRRRGREADRADLVAFCEARGLPPPRRAEKHHRVPFGTTVLRWEQHSEFTTYTWELPSDPGGMPFHPDAASLSAPMRLLPQPGPLLVAIDLHLLADDRERTAPERLFDRASLAVAENSDGAARLRHRLPARPVRLRAHSDRRSRHGGRARRRAGAARARDRDLSHAGAARPAGGAAAGAVDRPHRAAAGRGHRGDARHAAISPATTACSTN